MREPVLSTTRLEFVPNVPSRAGWLNDPEVVRYSELRHSSHTQEECDLYANSKDFARECQWGIFIRRTGGPWLHIGGITADIDQNNKVAQMGILLGEKGKWREGYGAEAWKVVMGWLFANGVYKIEAGCMDANHGMRGICQISGMHREAVIKGRFLLDDKREDEVRYAKFTDHF